jgi:hypothetical protein
MGGRTLKTGQSRCFIGYKKHTLRLWLHQYPVGVQLVPLVSWVAPANVSSTACGSLGRWQCWRTPLCCCEPKRCWGDRPVIRCWPTCSPYNYRWN